MNRSLRQQNYDALHYDVALLYTFASKHFLFWYDIKCTRYDIYIALLFYIFVLMFRVLTLIFIMI